MSTVACQKSEPSLEQALLELDCIAPGVALLALGQTVFWDEPMKAGVAIKLRRMGSDRKFIAGIHDSDYFAKIPRGRNSTGKFKTFPHNDTTTKGLWSAAGEFSALFGSETVVTKEKLSSGGVRIDRITHSRPKFLDEITEAWGWRGVVSLDERPPVTAELALKPLLPELMRAFRYSTNLSLECLAGQDRESATALIEGLIEKILVISEEPGQTLSTFYQRLAPVMYEFAANAPVNLETAATTELLKFNTETSGLPRFEILGFFVNSDTRKVAVQSYNQAIKGSPGLYELSRFGTGSIPFDLIIPGKGRGTIRLGSHGAVIMTPELQFLSFRKPLTSIEAFAEIVEKKFGPNCSIVGKAVSLIGMLGREFVFVFHEGASGYVKSSRVFHNFLRDRIEPSFYVNPLLRVRYSAWDSLDVCCSWLKLPEVFQRPFGTEELCAPSFGTRWKDVGREQRELIQTLGKIKRPIELVRHLDSELGGSWKNLAKEYTSLEGRLTELKNEIDAFRLERDQLREQMRSEIKLRVRLEIECGLQFRSEIFEKAPDPEALQRREQFKQRVKSSIQRIEQFKQAFKALGRKQHALTEDPQVKLIHERRNSIELEAELKRARLIRSAVTASEGLSMASLRPSAWWFPLVSPDGLWFRETIDTCEAYLEPLLDGTIPS